MSKNHKLDFWCKLAAGFVGLGIAYNVVTSKFTGRAYEIMKLGHTDQNGNIEYKTLGFGIVAVTLDVVSMLVTNKAFRTADGAIYMGQYSGAKILAAKLLIKSVISNLQHFAHNFYALYCYYPALDHNLNQKFLSLKGTQVTLDEKKAILSEINNRGNSLAIQYQNCMKEVSKFSVNFINLLATGNYQIMAYNLGMGAIELFASIKVQYWFDQGKLLSLSKNRIHEQLNGTNEEEVIAQSEALAVTIMEKDWYLKLWSLVVNSVQTLNGNLFTDRDFIAVKVLQNPGYNVKTGESDAPALRQATDMIDFYARNALRFIEVYTVIEVLSGLLDKIEQLKRRTIQEGVIDAANLSKVTDANLLQANHFDSSEGENICSIDALGTCDLPNDL